MVFEKGQEVIVTNENGTTEIGVVVYQRMAPPDYNQAEAVSVKLDSQRQRSGYTGTMFLANKVQPV